MVQRNRKLLTQANQQLQQFAQVVNGDKAVRPVSKDEPLRVGVDLGTSSIVMVVLDQDDQVVYGSFEYDHAVRDGLVVNFMDSVRILSRLKEQTEAILGVTLTSACGAIPPGTGAGSAKIVANVIESAGFICREVVDEPTAAARFLQVKTGTVVDIGGGTTGVSVFKNKKLIQVSDEATGGFHMSLVVAGHHGWDMDTAEQAKRDPDQEDDVFALIRPVVEKMATITSTVTKGAPQEPVIVVGGAINFKDFIETFSKALGTPAHKPDFPQFVTPIGIAMYDHEG
ncbi:ethanolamine utilization protein EutJ [Levilactobacillus fujinensis]|uniref:Ethanolamine utilization protein EutJ n=1 Tax=Levilactobacillus fujinensis TaxID=2486024 RepID=A0ABW1TC34_9LACO|nr:ethanolamine utilization protein EutJ [Levilactobacillus fujinensis]